MRAATAPEATGVENAHRAIRRVMIVTGSLQLYSVRKGIAELIRAFPEVDWLIVEKLETKSLRVILRNQWRNLRKHGWRWIPYQTLDVAARLSGQWPGERFERKAAP